MDKYERILDLVLKAAVSEDETGRELAGELAQKAFKYTEYRMNAVFCDLEKRIEQDGYRTSAHNAYMDSLNIFLRYEASKGKEVPDLGDMDRKDLGDYANRLVADLAVSQR
ncbi:MAG: hypothetical protein IKS07_04355 [Lachnospiraceae bacterium]|nr:hypothetical protein [Lachnospiraceae bacterium]